MTRLVSEHPLGQALFRVAMCWDLCARDLVWDFKWAAVAGSFWGFVRDLEAEAVTRVNLDLEPSCRRISTKMQSCQRRT